MESEIGKIVRIVWMVGEIQRVWRVSLEEEYSAGNQTRFNKQSRSIIDAPLCHASLSMKLREQTRVLDIQIDR